MPVTVHPARDPVNTTCSMVNACAPPAGKQKAQLIKYDQGVLSNLLYRAACKMPWHSPVDRKRTLDNKQNQCSQRVPTRHTQLGKEERALIEGVRATLKDYGAQVVFKFSQVKGAFHKQIMLHAKTQAGVCKALCDHWIVSHANGASLFDELYTRGIKGQFNIDTLVSIKQLNIDSMGRNTSQSQVSHNWLTQRGLEATPEVACGTLGQHKVDEFLKRLLESPANQYKSISLQAGLSGHAVVVYVGGQGEVRFFDPNFGDFRFPHTSTFKLWFKNEFWPREPYGFAETFKIVSYTSATSLQPRAGALQPSHIRG